jgi:hypothetical protein
MYVHHLVIYSVSLNFIMELAPLILTVLIAGNSFPNESLLSIIITVCS